MSEVRLTNLCKNFGAVTAVDHLDLVVADKEFVTLLGPSGCGKTTTLRMLGGFTKPDEGEISVGGRVMVSRSSGVFVPPEKRHMAMVFQNYALWPHIDVIENVMFGLRTRGVPKSKARAKAMDALSLVQLEGMAERYPHQLSGGQQQRVSLARAIASEPTVLLMDEPLSNLDAKFREAMRFEIKELHRELGVTSIYVTHDQAEAIVMSDRICVMWEGRLLQTASPVEIYRRPARTEVADFIGRVNFLPGSMIEGPDGKLRVETKCCRVAPDSVDPDLRPGQEVVVSIRPEHVRLSKARPVAADEANVFSATITKRVFLGNLQEYWVDLEGHRLRVQASVTEKFDENDPVTVRLEPDWISVIRDQAPAGPMGQASR